MNSTALKDYDGIVKRKVTELMDALAQRTSQPINISEWMSFFGYAAEILFPCTAVDFICAGSTL